MDKQKKEITSEKKQPHKNQVETSEVFPEIVEIRMEFSKDAVQVGKGGGCSWK